MTEASAYHIVLEPSDDGIVWTAEVPAFGFVTEGRGRAGARKAAENAIRGYLVGAKLHKLPVPESDAVIVKTRAAAAGRRREAG